MKNKILFFMVLFLVSICSVHASYIYDWKTTIEGNDYDVTYDSLVTTDGYVFVGYSSSTNISALTPKGENDATITKIDKSGKIIWQKNWGGSSNDVFYSIVEVSGGYVAVGYSISTDISGLPNSGNSDAVIVKFDTNGNLVNQYSYASGVNETFYSVEKTSDNGYIISGSKMNGSYTDGLICKYDSSFNLVWSKTLGGSKDESFRNVNVLSDGYVVTGTTTSTTINGMTSSGSEDGIIVKYGLNGNIVWQKLYGGSDRDWLNNSYVDNDYLYTLVLTTSTDIPNLDYGSNNYQGGLLSKFDTNGNVIWQKYYYDGELFHIVKGSGGYIVTNDNTLMKVDADGNTLWELEAPDSAYCIQENSDGSLVNFSSYYVNNNYYDLSFEKISKDKEVMWEKNDTYGYASATMGKNHVIAGRSSILKYDLVGNKLWQKNYDEENDTSLLGIAANDDSIIAVGEYQYKSGTILKTDKDGNKLWNKIITIGNYSILTSVTANLNDYVVVGYSRENSEYSGTISPLIIKYSSSGEIIWQKSGESEVKYNKILTVLDGYIVVGQQFTSKFDANGIIIKYDLNGNILWQKKYGNPMSEPETETYTNYDNFYSVTLCSDGYVVTGTTQTIDMYFTPNTSVGIIIKYDFDGNVIWQKQYDLNGKTILTDIIYTKIGYTAVGSINSKFLLMKVDLNGELTTTKKYYEADYGEIKSISSAIDGNIVVSNSRIVKYPKDKYDISVRTDNNGNANVSVPVANEGEVVQISITPNEEYRIKTLVVKDEKGNIIKVNEDNTFIMPDSDVTVEVTFETDLFNPKTLDLSSAKGIFISLIGISGIIGLAFITYINKKNVTL